MGQLGAKGGDGGRIGYGGQDSPPSGAPAAPPIRMEKLGILRVFLGVFLAVFLGGFWGFWGLLGGFFWAFFLQWTLRITHTNSRHSRTVAYNLLSLQHNHTLT